MDASRDPETEKTKRDKTTAKKPATKKQQLTDAYTRNQHESKSSNRGQSNLRHGKDERANTLTRPTSQDLAKASFGSCSPFGVGQGSVGNKSSTSEKKGIRKIVNHSLAQPQKSNPSTSASVFHAAVVDEVDFCDDDDLETFDIDCSPYNDVPECNEDENEREEHGADRSRGGLGIFQSGRSRRTVSPYPYRLRHKKQAPNEWAVDETTDPWDAGSFFEDKMRASPALGCTSLDLERNGYREENPHFRWHAHDSVEGRLSDLHLQDRYPVVDGDHGNHLKTCLKRKTNQRHARNVSWNDGNNEFDTTADNDHDITGDDGGCDKVKDKGLAQALVEERNEEIPPDVSLQQQTDPSQESVELHSCMMKTSAKSIYLYDDEAASLEVDNMKVGAGTGGIHSPPVSDDSDIDADRYSESKTNGETKDDVSKCCPSKDTNYPLRSLLQEWTDDAISQLTDDEKYRLIKEHEHLQIERYDDPHLCRADRIRLLWEDCARKERLLHRLRPKSAAKSLMDSKGSALSPNVNRYNHYNY